jgi:hypothetical protein
MSEIVKGHFAEANTLAGAALDLSQVEGGLGISRDLFRVICCVPPPDGLQLTGVRLTTWPSEGCCSFV